MCITVKKYVVFVVMVIGNVKCNPVMTNLNTSMRDFAVPEDKVNSTNVRTLQKEEFGRYASSAPVRTPIRFKDISDNELSSSSARALHHEHNGYGLLDYDDQHYGHGVDYNLHDTGHGHHGHHGHEGHHGGYGLHGHGHDLHDHHHGVLHGHHETHVFHGDGHGNGHGHGYGYGHGYKDLTHALAAKTILWPIAGIALLGAAAALVSNPVLLQLGVVSGRRKRRETSEAIDYDPHTLRKWLTTNPLQIITQTQADYEKKNAQSVISSVNILKPIDRKEILQDDIQYHKGGIVVDKDDILKRHRMNRLLNVLRHKRTALRKPSANPVYVNQSDLPRTGSDEDKHYIAVPLLSNS